MPPKRARSALQMLAIARAIEGVKTVPARAVPEKCFGVDALPVLAKDGHPAQARLAAPAVDLSALLPPEQIDALDLFDRLQLQAVIATCRPCASLSDAGRRLFACSREQRTVVNDADRLRKYLGRFGLSWNAIMA
jgi:hypothetical protein